MKPNGWNVYAIYNDFSFCRLDKTKQSADKSCLSTTCPTNDTNFVSTFDYAAYSMKN